MMYLHNASDFYCGLCYNYRRKVGLANHSKTKKEGGEIPALVPYQPARRRASIACRLSSGVMSDARRGAVPSTGCLSHQAFPPPFMPSASRKLFTWRIVVALYPPQARKNRPETVKPQTGVP